MMHGLVAPCVRFLAPTESTEVRVIDDEHSLFVCVLCRAFGGHGMSGCDANDGDPVKAVRRTDDRLVVDRADGRTISDPRAGHPHGSCAPGAYGFSNSST